MIEQIVAGYQVLSDGHTVWVNAPTGESVARFSARGIDVHRRLSEQRTKGECLDCVAGPLGIDAWDRFQESLQRNYGVWVDDKHCPRPLAPRLYCGQCNSTKDRKEFVGKDRPLVKMCAECRSRRTGGTYQRQPPRRHLPIASTEPPRIIWNPRSGNSKLGPIGAATVSAETCPPSCSFYGKGCYAERGHVEWHWRRAQTDGFSWEEFLGKVRLIKPGALWRYAVAGDLPGIGESLDRPRLAALVKANQGRRGFTFSHKILRTAADQAAIKAANEHGFTINLSADNLRQADARAALGIAPVAVVLPENSPHKLRTPEGRTVFVCPAQTRKGVTCQSCQVCSRPKRTSIVGFLAHGDMYATVSAIARVP